MAAAFERNILVCGDTNSGVDFSIAESVAEAAQREGHAAFPVNGLLNAYKHTRGIRHGVVFLVTNNLLPKRKSIFKATPEAGTPESFNVIDYMARVAAWNRIMEANEDPVSQGSKIDHVFLMTESRDPVPGFDSDSIYRLHPDIRLDQKRSFVALRARQMLASLPEVPVLTLVTNEGVIDHPVSSVQAEPVPVLEAPAEVLVA